MRILYHHRTLADGAEGIHIAEIVEALQALGHEICLHGPGLSPTATALPSRIHRLREWLPETIVQAAAVGYNVPDYVSVSRAIDQFRPDLIYKRHGRYDLACMVAAQRRGIPVLLEVNAVYSARPYRDFDPVLLRPMAEWLERRAFAAAASVYAVSTPMARQVRALGRADVWVLPNGANPARFDPARADASRVRSLYALHDTIVVGWTGILRDWHGLDLLLTAASQIRGITILIVGDGPSRSSVEARAHELGISERICITGRVPHGEIPAYIAAMDVSVVVADHTGVASPMKMLEYMAMGKAVMAPRSENICDVVEDEVDGLLFTPNDETDVLRTLNLLVGNQSLRDHLGRSARTKVERQRNWKQIAAAALRTLA